MIRFNDALISAALEIADNPIPSEAKTAIANSTDQLQDKNVQLDPDFRVRLIRDVYGKLRYAINCEREQYPPEQRELLEAALEKLGNYATQESMLFRDDFGNPDLIFGPDTEWHDTAIPYGSDDDGEPKFLTVNMLDRQIIGQDWLNKVERKPSEIHRIVFYGLKGGVGRSTALAMSAWHLAQMGKKVLLIDFDMESPGLSSLLIAPQAVAKYGLIDWFVEDAVGQADDELLKHMVSDSSLAVGDGSIKVVAAMGKVEAAYLSKLARAYVDVPAREHIYPDLPENEKGKGLQRFAIRMQRLVEQLEERERPDVVLIDSRAGLHDIAAIAITALADTALLFATDGAQSWNGYGQLFKHWQHRPEVCKHVRTKLAMVQALAPQNDLEKRATAFRQKAYELFSSTLYDKMPEAAPNTWKEWMQSPSKMTQLPKFFNPEMNNQFAPHFPIRIDWDASFQEFNPLLRQEDGGLSDLKINGCFGALFAWIDQRISIADQANASKELASDHE